MKPALVTYAVPGWQEQLSDLLPGAHVAVLADVDADLVGLEGRMAGLEFRDTIAVLRPGPGAKPRTSFILLFRKPLSEKTILAQLLKTGTGALNIDACRVGWGKDKPIPRGVESQGIDWIWLR